MKNQAVATTKQLNLLQKLGVNFDENITLKEASILIGKTLKQQKQTEFKGIQEKKENKVKTIFTKDIFMEFKKEFYQAEYSYFKEANFDTYFKYILKLDNYYIHFENPRIQTHFCFGHGYCGVSTQEEENDAANMAHHAATNEQYFMNYNLKDLNRKIEFLQDHLQKDYCNKVIVLCENLKTEKTKECYYTESFKDNNRYIENYSTCFDITSRVIKELSKDEIQLLIDALNEIKADFTKRLNSYLKRYGLSKIDTWTYLVD